MKTVQFRDPVYIGDPINAVRIFNDKQVDELVLLDIGATRDRTLPALSRIQEIASEAFMPVAYGGGITRLGQVEKVLKAGVEKVVINTAAAARPELVTEAARQFGSQAIVASIDGLRGHFGRYSAVVEAGRRKLERGPVAQARVMEEAGAGEILITSVRRDGTLRGYDLDLVRNVASAVLIPVIACGGAASVNDFLRAVREGGAAAVAAGSFFVFQGKHRAVLISFPDERELRTEFYNLVD